MSLFVAFKIFWTSWISLGSYQDFTSSSLLKIWKYHAPFKIFSFSDNTNDNSQPALLDLG